MKFNLKINNIDYTENTVLPFSVQKTLDESLDMAFIKLNYLEKEEPFSPLDDVLITITDENNNQKEFSFFVSSDKTTEIIQFKKFNHEIALIEQTKWLERFVGITKTNTTPIIKDYSSAAQFIPIMLRTETGYDKQFTYAGKDITTEDIKTGPYNVLYKTPYTVGYLPVISYKLLMEDIFAYQEGTFIKLNILFNDNLIKTINSDTETTEISTQNKGKYELQYWFKETGTGNVEYLSITFGMVRSSTKITYSITDVVNDLLKTFECLSEDESSRFSFNEEQAKEYEKVESPDFSLKGSLWECLSEIGSFIHAIPRLHKGKIYFEKLGQNNLTEIDLSEYCSNTSIFNIEQFATAIDSTVDNIVNVDEKSQGSVVAPFVKGFKTVRTETGVVQLTTDNILIETREPIEEIISVECGYISNGTLVGDITPYIFESAEYNALSALGGDFPTSRAYALKYTQGQKNITGLNFKIPNAVSSFFSNPAILNIIARKLKIKVSSIKNENLLKLQFRVKYIPVISARVRQTKNNIDEITYVSNLDFNQYSNKINSFAYGENMKGTIAKLGNPEISKMYIFKNLSFIPQVGDLFNDDYYISVVKLEFYKEFYKCEIALSKNFNKLNEYVGIKSQKRFYEISEKQSFDRYIIREDFCLIGTQKNSDNKSLITENGITKFISQFLYFEDANNKVIDVAKCTGFSPLQDELETVLLPVNSLGIGNSIILNFHYDDNYSAGNTRIFKDNTELQYQTQYTDINGRIETLKIDFGVGHTGINNYESAIIEGNKLPKTDENTSNVGNNILVPETMTGPCFSTNNNKLVIRKDNRENIFFTYQLNFVTTDKSFVLGTGLTRKSTFVTSESRKCKIVILPNKLNKFERFVDLTTAIEVMDQIENYTINGNNASIGGFTATTNGEAWAVVTNDGELVIGQNLKIKNNDQIPSIEFTFTHKII